MGPGPETCKRQRLVSMVRNKDDVLLVYADEGDGGAGEAARQGGVLGVLDVVFGSVRHGSSVGSRGTTGRAQGRRISKIRFTPAAGRRPDSLGQSLPERLATTQGREVGWLIGSGNR